MAPQLLEQAKEIASQIRAAAVPARGGSVAWLQPESAPGAPRAALAPQLYGGMTGIVLFLAACHRVYRDGESREMALAALAPLRGKLQEWTQSRERASSLGLGIGGLIGIGSLVHSFVQCGTWLDEPDLVREAHVLSGLFTPERIARDEYLDVVLGSAGAVLALLGLHERLPEPNQEGFSPLAAAAACGDHLLARRVSFEGGPRAWPPLPDRPPSSGFSHGAAGVCFALLRLYRATGREDYLEAAQEGLAFERGLYSPEQRNWRDTRVTYPRYLTMWCHGAPGIVLGRLAGLDVLDTPEVRRDIENGLATTRAVPLTDVDHLCCGNFGRADILLYASRKLSDEALAEEGREIARQALDRARANGRFGLSSPGEGAPVSPALFTGIAGIGYALLRLASPEILSCCLCLEPSPSSAF
jgi:type 2 lantibiotic biosynthesis protein LanM